jgi:N-acetylglutamate synthase-like GNAT family acetyltransferase
VAQSGARVMVTRKITKADIEAIDALFKEYGEDTPSVELCSGTGVLVENDGQLVGCGFLYITNSPISLIHLACIKKSLPRETRDQVADDIIIGLKNMAADHGYKYIICDPIFKKSGDRLEQHGFENRGNNVYWYEAA